MMEEPLNKRIEFNEMCKEVNKIHEIEHDMLNKGAPKSTKTIEFDETCDALANLHLEIKKLQVRFLSFFLKKLFVEED